MPTAPTPIPDSPNIPDRTAQATFSVRASAWADFLKNSWTVAANALGINAFNNATEAAASAVAGAASANAAANSATQADASAQTSAASANAPIWVSGTVYAIGNCRFSPTDFQTYRRKTAGAGAIDPALDVTNWEPLGGSMLACDTVLTQNLFGGL